MEKEQIARARGKKVEFSPNRSLASRWGAGQAADGEGNGGAGETKCPERRRPADTLTGQAVQMEERVLEEGRVPRTEQKRGLSKTELPGTAGASGPGGAA